MSKPGYVYIMTNETNHVLYTGVTSNLLQRVCQHKESMIKGFTKKYHVNKIVYYEEYKDIRDAITREKQIKAGSRRKKIEAIDSFNPDWHDLYSEIPRT